MDDMTALAGRLKDILKMDTMPVGVRFFAEGEALTSSTEALEEAPGIKSYCRGIINAARGEMFYGRADRLGCVLGTATLGLEKAPDPLLEKNVQEKFKVGLYDSEQASRASVEIAPKFQAGTYQSVLMGPLDKMPASAQLVIFEVNAEQVMWLLYGVNYLTGGKQELPQSGGVAGGCADITVDPILNGNANITFLGLGCRIKSGIGDDRLLFGLPASELPNLVENLNKMAKPMAALAKAKIDNPA